MIHSIDVKTGKKNAREWAEDELDKHQRAIDDNAPTEEEIKLKGLVETEDNAILSRKLEEIIDHLENTTPISQESKDWAADRKSLREE